MHARVCLLRILTVDFNKRILYCTGGSEFARKAFFANSIPCNLFSLQIQLCFSLQIPHFAKIYHFPSISLFLQIPFHTWNGICIALAQGSQSEATLVLLFTITALHLVCSDPACVNKLIREICVIFWRCLTSGDLDL